MGGGDAEGDARGAGAGDVDELEGGGWSGVSAWIAGGGLGGAAEGGGVDGGVDGGVVGVSGGISGGVGRRRVGRCIQREALGDNTARFGPNAVGEVA